MKKMSFVCELHATSTQMQFLVALPFNPSHCDWQPLAPPPLCLHLLHLCFSPAAAGRSAGTYFYVTKVQNKSYY